MEKEKRGGGDSSHFGGRRPRRSHQGSLGLRKKSISFANCVTGMGRACEIRIEKALPEIKKEERREKCSLALWLGKLRKKQTGKESPRNK